MSTHLRRLYEALLALLLLLTLLGGAAPLPPTELRDQVRVFTRAVEFDYPTWTMEAFAGKLGQAALGTPFYFAEDSRHRIVVDYLQLIDQILANEYSLGLVYSDPAVADPESASRDLRSDLDGLYARQAQLAPLAEAILEQQVSTLLADLELTLGGQPIPPVLFHISPLPYHLVVSPRERIQQELAVSLDPDLTVDRQASIEAQIDSALDVSSLVVPIGGLGSYPTMIMRTTSLSWLAEVIAHEWIHNWLTLRPLGANYNTTPELRTMNETTASIAGSEIARLLLGRYYPELLAAYDSLAQTSLPSSPRWPEGAPRPPFDFRAQMYLTRVRVDSLLAEGRIAEAEAYMEARRLVFWEHGYPIRRLNQAYFAFHGAYASYPGGAAGEDPVGPAVRVLREQSDSLTDFLKTIAAMDSFDDLQAVLAR
ncbi:MAG: hypothetical protein JXB85_00855 [Anaerolineales bacterium]|nr:hypothetical protein [Anaerolineales bacterium]